MAASRYTLSDMDLRFARSRRRVAARRRRPTAPAGGAWRRTRAVLIVGGVMALVGVMAAEAQTPGTRPAGKAAKGHAGVPGCPIPARFVPGFLAASRETAVPLSLLVAVAYEESRMDPGARSRAGAQGLLQVMPATARELQVDAGAPRGNVLAGARYLARMMQRFGGDRSLALAAYNAGPGAVERAGGAPFLETLSYVANVEARVAKLAACDVR